MVGGEHINGKIEPCMVGGEHICVIIIYRRDGEDKRNKALYEGRRIKINMSAVS